MTCLLKINSNFFKIKKFFYFVLETIQFILSKKKKKKEEEEETIQFIFIEIIFSF